MYPKLLAFIFIIGYISSICGLITTCRSYTGEIGNCLPLNQCPPLFAILNKPYTSGQELEILRRSQCGFDNFTPKVCCPQTRISPPPVSDIKCFTPDGVEGKCVNPYSCPQLSDLLQQPITIAVQVFIQNLRCGQSDNICCALSTSTIGDAELPLKPRQCSMTASLPDPQSGCCGRHGDNSNRIIGGNQTSIDHYPWLAVIEYQKGSRIELLCGGTLISGRYVLTAAHCVHGSALNIATPVNVRLGEYDTSNAGPDCVPADGGGEDCTDGPITIPIEKTIPHPQYDTRLERNDIALIRLKQMLTYTDFVRPICLPTFDVYTLTSNVIVSAAGWGITEMNRNSKLKLHVDLPLVSLEACSAVYQKRFQRPLWSRQLCAGGERGKDSCKGDSGGPLMYKNGDTYELVGVVSFGPMPCAQLNIPGVYTSVFQYKTWIQSHFTS